MEETGGRFSDLRVGHRVTAAFVQWSLVRLGVCENESGSEEGC